MTIDEGVLGKIRKLLAKAEDPSCTEAEAEAFNIKAAQLIAKYGIDQAHIEADDNTGVMGGVKIELHRPYVLDKLQLLVTVAETMRCVVIRLGRGEQNWGHLIGYRSDVDRVEVIYSSLLVQQSIGLARSVKDDKPLWEDTRTYNRSWFIGFRHAVFTRLRKAEMRAAADASRDRPGTDLVLRDRGTAVNEHVDQLYPEVPTARQRRPGGGTGYRNGFADGMKANLGTTGLGQSTEQTSIGGR